jgi:hypothetical protein
MTAAISRKSAMIGIVIDAEAIMSDMDARPHAFM